MRLQQIRCLLLLTLSLVKAKVDFSQFYLPPCCQLPYIEAIPGQRIGASLKREAVEKHSTQSPNDSSLIKSSETTQGKTYMLTVPFANFRFAKIDTQISTNKASNTSDLELHQTQSTRVPRMSSVSQIVTDASWEPQKFKSVSTDAQNADQMVAYNMLGTAADQLNREIPTRQMKTLPAFWVKYLKRALYQSLTDGKGLDNSSAFNSRNNAKVEKPKLKFPHFWKSIKTAPLQYVDKMSQVSTDPQATLFLPEEEGPIVSGVLVNSPYGSLQLRVASELHNLPTDDPNCRCYLINPGEILMAYWTVGRIFKEDGAPALQYLVHPLPHSVPTPPEMIPFQNAQMFLASPMDPFQPESHFGNIQNQIEQFHVPPLPSPFPVTHPEQVPHLLHVNNHPRGSIPEEIHPMIRPFTSNAGFPFNENGAIQNFLNNQAINNYQTIPFSDLNVNVQNSLDLSLPFQTPTILPPPRIVPSGSPEPSLPTTPTAPVEKLAKPTFPKSIQDIISPETNQQPHPTPSQDDFTSSVPTLQPQFNLDNNNFPPSAPSPIPPIQFIHPLQHLPIIFNIPPAHLTALPIRPTKGDTIGTKERNAFRVRGKATLISKGKFNDETNRAQPHPNVKVSENLPYIVHNLLDNERKYYPLRQSQNYYQYLTSNSKDRKRQVHPYRHQARRSKSKLYDIDNKQGYILDF